MGYPTARKNSPLGYIERSIAMFDLQKMMDRERTCVSMCVCETIRAVFWIWKTFRNENILYYITIVDLYFYGIIISVIGPRNPQNPGRALTQISSCTTHTDEKPRLMLTSWNIELLIYKSQIRTFSAIQSFWKSWAFWKYIHIFFFLVILYVLFQSILCFLLRHK